MDGCSPVRILFVYYWGFHLHFTFNFRLRRNAATAEERLEFAQKFFLGLFHAEMSKTIQDICALMKDLVNLQEVLSLGWFRCLLGLSSVTNDPKVMKTPGQYEKHIQFLETIGTECIIEAFRTTKQLCTPVNSDSSFEAVKTFVFEVLSKAGIQLYFNPDEDEPVYYDDVQNYCRNLSARTIISLVFTRLEHEGDATGLRAIRKLLIPYTLNRKHGIQDSKYDMWLTLDEVSYSASSERTKARVDALACANTSGKQGGSIHRDKLNEIIIQKCKNSLKGMHSSLEDILVEKTISSMNVTNQIVDHDRESMLLPVAGGGSSQKLFSREDIMEIRNEYRKIQPFVLNRDKHFFKTKQSPSVYSGLTMNDFERFLIRNKQNFARHNPHK